MSISGRYQRKAIRRAIIRFGTRLNAATLRVTPLLDKTRQGSYNTLQFEIRGQILTQPYPTEFGMQRADMGAEPHYVLNTGHYLADPRLLEYYNRELSYLRETGAEFATLHPKIAARLGMQGTDIADPYVERMRTRRSA